MIGSVYVNCVTSPISDHLLVGSSHDHALLFDLQVELIYQSIIGINFTSSFQESRMYKQDQANSVYHPRRQQTAKYLNHPKFKFGGHRFNVSIKDFGL